MGYAPFVFKNVISPYELLLRNWDGVIPCSIENAFEK
jgi:hypothetical protein